MSIKILRIVFDLIELIYFNKVDLLPYTFLRKYRQSSNVRRTPVISKY